MNNDNGNNKPNNPKTPPSDKNTDSTRIMPVVNPTADNVPKRLSGTPQDAPHPPRQQRAASPQPARPNGRQSVRPSGQPSAHPVGGVPRPSGIRPKGGRTALSTAPSERRGNLNSAPPAPNIPQHPHTADGSKSMGQLDRDRRRHERHEDKAYERGAGGVVSSIVKALVYIVLVFGLSVFLAYNAILIGNDIFAFVKPSNVIKITIPVGAELSDVSQILKDNGLIKYPSIFELYAKYRKRDKDYIPGVYTISSAQNYDEMMIELRKSIVDQKIVRLTFKEGITVDEIISMFVQNGIGSKAKFMDVINNYDFNYDFLDELDKGLPEGRKYRLEGYLYPDTYDFFAEADESAIITKFLDNFDQKFNDVFRTRCKTIGMTIDQAINLASIVQGEARHPEDFTLISSVFHNRLESSQFPRLESDATIQYTFATHKSELTAEDLQIQSPYNTYVTDGLPPSAICNPGFEAINAALYPENTDNYYFVSDKAGNTLYAKTLDEHNTNIRTVRGQ